MFHKLHQLELIACDYVAQGKPSKAQTVLARMQSYINGWSQFFNLCDEVDEYWQMMTTCLGHTAQHLNLSFPKTAKGESSAFDYDFHEYSMVT